ncbi:hypothetical protein EC957_004527 [Mortierella hygrophila]|uniref:glucan endo-1,3-beta-D-glucosidase n=1 Tax=Mortierella hygrophila TaxID=979708 RepID=A0A9P6K787_9FUNG|nr:hypothetical protein EC957_004527 [Mortierella hygrophila]
MDPRTYNHSGVPPQPYIETLQSDTPSHLYPFSPSDNQDEIQHVPYTNDSPAPTAVTVNPQNFPQQQQHFYEQHHNPIIYNVTDNSIINSNSDNFSGAGVGHAVEGHNNTAFLSLTASSASSTIHDSSIVTSAPPPLSSNSVPGPAEPAAVASTITSSTHQSLSFMDSIFKKKHHRRRSASVLGWDSDDDEVMDRTTVAPSEHRSNSSSSQDRMASEKSVWLQKEHGKQKRVKICICVGVVACFIVLGAILGFTYKEQWTRRDYSNIGTRPKNVLGGPQPTFTPGVNPLEQLHQAIESTFHVNTTINPDPNLHKVFYGIDYTPRGSQEPDCRVNLGNVIEDIKVLSQLTTRIRLYGMACSQADDVMKALQYLDLPDMQVILTLWVDNNKASWEKQTRSFWNLIDNTLIMDAGTYTSDMLHEQAIQSADTTTSKVASRIIGISVGNEVLFRNEDPTNKKDHVSLDTLGAYIQEIRRGLSDRAASTASSSNPTYSALGQQLTQIPIFSSDLGRNAHQIVDKVDWVLSNIHPFFAYTSASQAADWAFANFKDETLKAARGKPAMISEVGWPSGPSSAALGPAVPSVENLQTFVNTWVCQANIKNVPYYYFEAFDEPWKNSINPRESQWGLMTVDRKLKVTIPNC